MSSGKWIFYKKIWIFSLKYKFYSSSTGRARALLSYVSRTLRLQFLLIYKKYGCRPSDIRISGRGRSKFALLRCPTFIFGSGHLAIRRPRCFVTLASSSTGRARDLTRHVVLENVKHIPPNARKSMTFVFTLLSSPTICRR